MNTRNTIVSAVVALLSAGWLFPMWLGVSTCLSFWSLEGGPMLPGRQTGNSFPFLAFAGDCFAWGFAWLGVVVVFWSYVGFSAVLRLGEVRA
ncbi:hypothetical protein [Lysobacter capsici]|uniref:hypothetical protein n=1 Tax=Lysobacter capsici TaxID=435897 RepID=UPI001C001630|nr:hypothetical protein [Lysobacter capsici]QWF19064.1 hypothetical protein KME82_10160 [Lysobacter capsici]